MTEFWKMSGAGNDFVTFDNRDKSLDRLLTADFIRGICDRGNSIGADGVLTLERSDSAPFGMGYWNRDGGRAAMCGNGGRCMCVFARLRGAVTDGGPFAFTSDAGEHRGMVTGPGTSRIWMTEPEIHYLDRTIDYGGAYRVSLVDTGVRHAVLFVDGDDGWEEFGRLAGVLRNHPDLAPAGANVNYARITGNDRIIVRTFEKGVEAETLACGSGAVAVALASREIMGDLISLPLEIVVRSGQVLTVGEDGFGWWLEGEARVVYRGFLESPLT